jgi:hypothetical protein
VTSKATVPHPPQKANTPRSLTDLVRALNRHVRLLRLYAKQAFDAHDDDYLGEVAAKLRLLTIEKKNTNVPLLIEIMNVCEIKAPLVAKAADGSRRGDPMSLAEVLDGPAVKVVTSTGDVRLTKRELIKAVAEKHGGAHEDWAHPEYLTVIRESKLRVKGYSSLAAVLKPIATAVLTTSDHVLPRLTPAVIAKAEERRKAKS